MTTTDILSLLLERLMFPARYYGSQRLEKKDKRREVVCFLACHLHSIQSSVTDRIIKRERERERELKQQAEQDMKKM